MNRHTAITWLVAGVVSLLVGGAVHAGVVGPWTLDDPVGTSGTGSVVESQHARNGTPSGAVTFGGPGANANTGTSASFSNSVVNVPFNPDLNPASFTAMAWTYPTGGSGHRSPFTSRYDGAGGQGYILYINPSNQWDFWTGNGPTAGNWHTLTGGAVAFDTWSHVAVSFDAATSTKSIYVNGNPSNSVTGPNYTPNTLRDLHIGSGGDTGTQYRFVGAVDDFVLFDEALDQAAIQDVMNNSVPDPDLISAGKSYAYEKRTPHYHGGTYYYDDPHTEILGVFDVGEMTDGVYLADGATPTVPAVNPICGWGEPASTEGDIIVDLEQIYSITGVTLGTHTFSAYRNGAPDDVTLSFSTDGVTFGSPITQGFFAPPNNGHSDFVVEVPEILARYVKLEFDGGALGLNNPNKWMLDEISVHGSIESTGIIPEPSALLVWSLLAGLGIAWRWRRRR